MKFEKLMQKYWQYSFIITLHIDKILEKNININGKIKINYKVKTLSSRSISLYKTI